MVTKKPYMPRTDNDKAIWLANFVEKLKLYDVALSISPATITQLETDRDIFVGALVLVEQLKDSLEGVTAFKNNLRDGGDSLVAPSIPVMPPLPPTIQNDIFGRVRKLVRVIKGNPNYSESIGDSLRIIGEDTPDPSGTWKPILSVTFQASVPTLKWKKGKSNGIKLWVDRGDGQGFRFLVINTKAAYTDTHPLPPAGQTALWKYQAVYLVKDEEVGLISDILDVTVTGKNI